MFSKKIHIKEVKSLHFKTITWVRLPMTGKTQVKKETWKDAYFKNTLKHYKIVY